MAVGGDKLEDAGALLGLGRRSGVGLWEESMGTLPGPAWVERNRLAQKNPYPDKWSDGRTCSLAIGQGAVEVTPLQMANVYATIANGGTVWRPRLLDGLATATADTEELELWSRIRAADLREQGLTQDGLEQLKLGIEGATTRHLPNATGETKMAVRLGLAQNWRRSSKEYVRDNIAFLAGYFPKDQPRWVLTLVVQNTRGGHVVMPLATHIFEQVSAVESGTLKVTPQPLAPAKGHFNLVEPKEEQAEE